MWPIIFIFFSYYYLAPGTYSPEKSMDALKDTPRYTFGHRPDLDKPNNLPGMIRPKNASCRLLFSLFIII
jgi:Sperm-tail PG-rich repeat